MPINKKSFKTLEPIYFETPDKDTEMVKNTFSTSQGLTLNKYKIFENLNDLKVKNYSVNILTDEIDFNDFFKYDLDKNFKFLDFNTSITFNALNSLSAISFLDFDRNQSFTDSGTNLGNYTGAENQSFVLDFVDEKLCTIKAVDNGIEKFLTVLEEQSNEVKFTSLTNNYISTSSFLFEYDFDKTNLFITLFKTLTGGDFKILAPAGLGTPGAGLSGISLLSPTNSSCDTGVIKISKQMPLISKDDLNSFVFYDNDHNISNETLKNRKNNYLGWYPYEITALSGNPDEGQSQRFINVLDFMNLRNQVSNDNFVNPTLPLSGNETNQKKYSSLLNVDNKEFENEEMLLGYNFYTKEYNFLPDKYTKFTLPDSLFPYRRLNINDSNLSKAGSHAGESPYFSDKVFKLLDANKNENKGAGDLVNLFELQREIKVEITSQNGKVGVKENPDAGGFLLLQNGFRLGNEDFNDPQDVENNGSILCSWLSGNNNEEGIWFDRYYNPKRVSYLAAITGVNDQAFEKQTQAKKYFVQNGLETIYYDIKSNLVFEPRSTYFYQRIGNKYINEIIDGLDYRLLKDTFNVKLSSQELLNENELVFDKKGYDITNFDLIKLKDFNISFDLNLDTLNSLDNYQIFGNLYQDGFSLKNNFYFTPFVFLPHGNKLSIYDKDFNLLTENTYTSISAIKDVLYLEQHNNLVLVGDDRIIKTSFTGELIDQRLKETTLLGDSTINSIVSSYDNRYFYDYNKVLFLTKGSNELKSLDLNNLSLSSTINNVLSSGSSVIQDASGNFVSLTGFKGKYLNDETGVALTDRNTILFQNIDNRTTLGNLSTFRHIYDINTFNEKLYIQSFTSDGAGFIHVFSSERDLLSTVNLSTSAVSGASLDFVNDRGEVKILSFGKNSSGNLIIDKISTDNPYLSTNNRTYFLPLTTQDLNHDLYQGNNFYNPTNFQSIYYKYREKQNKLHFVVSLDSFIGFEDNLKKWNLADYRYATPGADLSAWGTKFQTTNIDNLISQEQFVEFKNLKLKNDVSFNFKLNDGLIEVFLNGDQIGKINFTPNRIALDRLIFPDIFYNTPNIKNNPINTLIDTEEYYGKGGTISNFKLYNNNLEDNFINFLHLKDKRIDSLNFDITTGTRNNIEEMNNIYNVNLPGIKNNNIKVYVKNANLSKIDRDRFKEFLNNKIKRVLPSNIDTIEYDFNVNI
jgi:hypothetical protein